MAKKGGNKKKTATTAPTEPGEVVAPGAQSGSSALLPLQQDGRNDVKQEQQEVETKKDEKTEVQAEQQEAEAPPAPTPLSTTITENEGAKAEDGGKKKRSKPIKPAQSIIRTRAQKRAARVKRFTGTDYPSRRSERLAALHATTIESSDANVKPPSIVKAGRVAEGQLLGNRYIDLRPEESYDEDVLERYEYYLDGIEDAAWSILDNAYLSLYGRNVARKHGYHVFNSAWTQVLRNIAAGRGVTILGTLPHYKGAKGKFEVAPGIREISPMIFEKNKETYKKVARRVYVGDKHKGIESKFSIFTFLDLEKQAKENSEHADDDESAASPHVDTEQETGNEEVHDHEGEEQDLADVLDAILEDDDTEVSEDGEDDDGDADDGDGNGEDDETGDAKEIKNAETTEEKTSTTTAAATTTSSSTVPAVTTVATSSSKTSTVDPLDDSSTAWKL